MNRTLCCVLVSILWFCAYPNTGHANDESFLWTRSLPTEPLTQDEIISVELDSDIYAETQADYADLRIADAHDVYVPYLLEKMTSNDTLIVTRNVPSNLDGIEKKEENRIVFNLSVTSKKDPVINGINIDTPLRDFERRITVSGMLANGEWKELVDGALVYDYTRFIDLRETKIRIPPDTYKKLRLDVNDITDEKESTMVELERTFKREKEVQRVDRTSVEKVPFRINRISLWTEEEREVVRVDRKKDYPVVSFDISVNSEEKKAEVLLKTRREPLTQIVIEAAGQNFNRRAHVQVPVRDGTRKKWRTISSGVISQISFRDFNRTQNTLTFPAQRSEEYRVLIENKDNPPLRVTGVSVRGDMYQVLFLAQPENDYVLRYGNDSSVRPDYDAGAILGAVRGGYIPRRVLPEDPIENTKYRRGGGFSFFNGKVFFGLVVGIVIITLVLALYRAGKHFSAASNEES